jgi:hypothetical protein
MTRVLLGIVLAVCLSLGVSAQIPGLPTGCPTCGVYSYVDLPAPEVTVSASNFVIAGWGFECFSGAVADRVDIFYQDYDGYWVPLRQPPTALNYGSVDRPDVQMAFRPYCPNVPGMTGWHLFVTNPPPLGLRRVQINVWRGPYYEVHRRTYLIVP